MAYSRGGSGSSINWIISLIIGLVVAVFVLVLVLQSLGGVLKSQGIDENSPGGNVLNIMGYDSTSTDGFTNTGLITVIALVAVIGGLVFAVKKAMGKL